MKIIYLKDELHPRRDCPLITYPFEEVSLEKLKEASREECLLIAAKDSTIKAGKEYGIPTLGYCNPAILNQQYYGVEMLVEGFDEVDDRFILRVFQRAKNIPWDIAETKRCLIRELSLEDLPDLYDLYAQPGITEFMEDLYPYEEEYAYEKAYIENMYRYYGYGMWLVFEKSTGKLIGRAGLEHRELEGEVYLEMGYAIHPDYQGRGYGTEVCEAILAYARENTEFPGLICLVSPNNRASIALLNKIGGKMSKNSRNTLKNTTYIVYNIPLR